MSNRFLIASNSPFRYIKIKGINMPKSKKPIFVIQQHAATSMHYDFRLEIEGSLKSWSIPKGPSTDTKCKRLAIETEDHDLSYADFEGIIPEGKYGAGKVLLWDTGTYKNLKKETSIEQSYKKGLLEFWLEGKKLKGGYALVKMKESEKNWLFVKMDDEEADARRNPVSTEPESVKSGKTIEEIDD
jgi:DNA ligase D-like protein (predicted 3'-phosphoesterase)